MRRRRFYALPSLLGAILPRPDIEVDMTRSQALTFSARTATPVSIEIVLLADFGGDVERLAEDVRARVDGPVSSLTVRRASPGEREQRVTLTRGPGRST